MRELDLEKYLENQDPSSILEDLDKYESEQSLRNFIKLAWPILEPGRVFTPGWHIDAICDHLEAVSNGSITRLLINVPPGCMKSLTTNVFWPAWEWGPLDRPSSRYVGASYSQDLTIRDNRRCRTLIQHPWYQRLWGHKFQLTSDQNAKVRFDTDKTGFKIATSVAGLGTGERGDRFIIDDPHNVREGESEIVREGVILWFTEVVPTRINDPEKSAIIVIMQRVHELDVSGYILSKELGYTPLILPMEFEPERKCIVEVTGFEDPRTMENELIWPKRMTRATVEREKKTMGSYAVAGQFQQRPAPRGGGMFQREWFPIVDAKPAKVRKRVRGWDLANSETRKAKYTAGVRMSRGEDGMFYIEHVSRFRASPEKVDRALEATSSQDGISTEISMPQDPGQAGKAQKRYFANLLAGYNIKFSVETGDKEVRADPFARQAEAGNVRMVRGSWNTAYLDELCSFPFGEYSDQVDASSRAFNELIVNKRRGIPVSPTLIELEDTNHE